MVFAVVVIAFNPAAYNISEGAGVITLLIERRGATAQSVIFTLSTAANASSGMSCRTCTIVNSIAYRHNIMAIEFTRLSVSDSTPSLCMYV